MSAWCWQCLWCMHISTDVHSQREIMSKIKDFLAYISQVDTESEVPAHDADKVALVKEIIVTA